MGDYGMRRSIEGEDVFSADDLDTILNSKYANLKGSLSGSGVTPNIPHDTTVTITISHGLGYIPFARVLTDWDGTSVFSNSPEFQAFITQQIDIWHYCDATNMYIKIYQGNDFAETLLGFDYNFFIFVDKGKL